MRCYGEDGILGRGVLSLAEDEGGNLWAGAESGLWRWEPGSPRLYRLPHSGRVFEIRDLSPTADGQMLIATNDGMIRIVGDKAELHPTGGSATPSIPSRILRDRDGGLWIGTSGQGLLHVHQGRTDTFSRADGLSTDNIFGLFEDREGNIWVATQGGIDRFRELPVTTVSAKQGLTNDVPWSVLAARDGSVWAAGRNGL
ncbi:MAG TPA: two-component regulator propeller domain-containing protein, partial [Candidatus Acidoferrum sp.]|nr:two-component regulator propeller domain-containing protein [Candidatus Acidoferrum sp.]